MSIVKSVGKNTLGGGKKMLVSMHEYHRSTHDLSYTWRTTMAPGLLVPNMKLVSLPGDTWDIDTAVQILTHPTIGPLFGSFKHQTDYFFCPIRLYNALLHNNALNIGLKMNEVKIPKCNIRIQANKTVGAQKLEGSNGTLNNTIHPSSLLAYLGYRQYETISASTTDRWFGDIIKNAVPIIAYLDIFKNYYANKQEKNFYWVGDTQAYCKTAADSSVFTNQATSSAAIAFGQASCTNWNGTSATITNVYYDNTGDWPYLDEQSLAIIGTNAFIAADKSKWKVKILHTNGTTETIAFNDAVSTTLYTPVVNGTTWNYAKAYSWNYRLGQSEVKITAILTEGSEISLKSAELSGIDTMRENILKHDKSTLIINSSYNTATGSVGYSIIPEIIRMTSTGNAMVPEAIKPNYGLICKTYQSDWFNNWVQTDWIDGDNGINAITAIDTSAGNFTLDTLNLAKKVYNMLNRIAVSGGTYNDWVETVYTVRGNQLWETPVYIGGISSEIQFQEVFSTAATEEQPLGSLGGRGVTTDRKGGHIHFKCEEPGYIIGITSITPRVDYCQGNDWDNDLETLDDLHKPALDGIGYQDLQVKRMVAGTTKALREKSLGKQPAWIQYMTNVNKTYGNFALAENEGWMCLNRYYSLEGEANNYSTYIDPMMYNNIFADTSLEAQNFWVQLFHNIKVRRVMSAKQIPNL